MHHGLKEKKKNQNFLKLVETVPDLYLNQN